MRDADCIAPAIPKPGGNASIWQQICLQYSIITGGRKAQLRRAKPSGKSVRPKTAASNFGANLPNVSSSSTGDAKLPVPQHEKTGVQECGARK